MAKLIKSNGMVHDVFPKDGKEFTLEELQGFVGGYIEVVRHQEDGEERFVIVNEEGKIDGLPDNPLATSLYPLRDGDFYVGDVLVCNEIEFN